MKYFFLIFLSSFSSFAIDCNLRSPVKSYTPRYAKFFKINYYSGFKVLIVSNHEYFLSNNKNIKCRLPKKIINIPVTRVALSSTTYLPSLIFLNEEQSLIAFQGKSNIVSPQFKLGHIIEIPFKFNTEYLTSINANLIMGYDSNLSSIKQEEVFTSLGLPVVINKDYEEKTPLGRAEWIVFIASFYDKDLLAIKYFNEIESRYLKIKENNKIKKSKPVLIGNILNGLWEAPGGESDLGQLVKDAGGELVFYSKNENTQHIPIERIVDLKTKDYIWLTHNLWETKQEVETAIKKDSRYSFVSFDKIFNNNLILNKNKANDYWEEALQRPDLLLLDLSAIIHPESYKNHKLRWYRPL
jgi:iron complex transport system substrate-binding protein